MKTLVMIFIGLLFLAACSPVMYTPTAYHVPMFEEKGEVAITAGYHGIEEGDGDGINLQIATAVDSSFAITFTINYFKDVYRSESRSTNDYWRSSGVFLEAGVGKFGFIGNSSLFKYEIYGGMGYGRSTNREQASRVSAAYLKPFIQPNIGISGKHIELALSARLATVSFLDPDYYSSSTEYLERIRDFFDKKGTSLVFEPGFTLRGGFSDLKAQIQYSYSTFRYQEPTGQYFGYSDNYISLGLFWLISERYR